MTDQAVPSDPVRRYAGILARGSGWMRFLSVLQIVGGLLSAVTIVGIVVAWIPIWLGVLLWQAADATAKANSEADPASMERALDRIQFFFTLNGILTLVGIGLGILAFLIVVFMLGGLAAIGDLPGPGDLPT
jgi:type IV secretory pathway TrbD component